MLKQHGHRYSSNHFSAVPSMPNIPVRIDKRMLWSTVSKVAERSNVTSEVIACFSMSHSMSLLSFKSEVSQK